MPDRVWMAEKQLQVQQYFLLSPGDWQIARTFLSLTQKEWQPAVPAGRKAILLLVTVRGQALVKWHLTWPTTTFCYSVSALLMLTVCPVPGSSKSRAASCKGRRCRWPHFRRSRTDAGALPQSLNMGLETGLEMTLWCGSRVHSGGRAETAIPTALLRQDLGAQAWAEMDLLGCARRDWMGGPGEAHQAN